MRACPAFFSLWFFYFNSVGYADIFRSATLWRSSNKKWVATVKRGSPHMHNTSDRCVIGNSSTVTGDDTALVIGNCFSTHGKHTASIPWCDVDFQTPRIQSFPSSSQQLHDSFFSQNQNQAHQSKQQNVRITSAII
jgi:hypothetical protein